MRFSFVFRNRQNLSNLDKVLLPNSRKFFLSGIFSVGKGLRANDPLGGREFVRNVRNGPLGPPTPYTYAPYSWSQLRVTCGNKENAKLYFMYGTT